MRFARKLARIVFVLAIIAAALGGAVALGSSIFPSPPRDAAEFAERANGGTETTRPRGAKARRRYIRAFEASCRRQRRDGEALGRPTTMPELVTYLEQVLALFRHYERESLGVRTPRAFRDEEARFYTLGIEGIDLIERMLVAARRDDPYTIGLVRTALIDVIERQNEIARRIGALDCVFETPVAAY